MYRDTGGVPGSLIDIRTYAGIVGECQRIPNRIKDIRTYTSCTGIVRESQDP